MEVAIAAEVAAVAIVTIHVAVAAVAAVRIGTTTIATTMAHMVAIKCYWAARSWHRVSSAI